MSKQPPPAPTASTIGPCPTVFKVSRTPWHWKFTQHLRPSSGDFRSDALLFMIIHVYINIKIGKNGCLMLD